jgi:uncharacterized membrane protein YdbT with pleckstrin-like domain
MIEEEVDVWEGTPSQVVNLGTFIFGILLFFLVIPLFYALWKWLVVKNIKYELTSQRLKTHSGVFNKHTNELELYRVKDYKLIRPFFLRIFSLGNVELETSDRSNPTVTIRAIPDAEAVRENLRSIVEKLRRDRGVREVDFE